MTIYFGGRSPKVGDITALSNRGDFTEKTAAQPEGWAQALTQEFEEDKHSDRRPEADLDMDMNVELDDGSNYGPPPLLRQRNDLDSDTGEFDDFSSEDDSSGEEISSYASRQRLVTRRSIARRK